MHLVFALSLQGQLEQIGALAGLAAIPGLAILALLYFSQAREVKRLREWAGRAPERAQELQERVVEKASAARTVPPAATPAAGKRVVAQPVPGRGAQPAANAAPPGGGTQPPAPPAKAPAVPPAKAPAPAPGTAAARAPAAAPGTPAQRPATPAGTPAPGVPASTRQPAVPAGARAGATAPAASAAAAPAAAPTRPRPDGDGTGAATGTRVAAKPPPRPTGGQTAGARPARPAAAPLRAARPAAKSASRAPLSGGRGRGRALADRLGRRGAALIAVLVLVLVIGGVFLVTSSGGGGSAAKPVAAKPNAVGPAPAPTKKRPPDGAPVQRGKITVAVLNGTTIPGLAAQVSDQLQKGGFKRGSVTNASDQQRPATQVAYAPGYKRAGDEVAGLLKIRSAAQPMDAGTQAIAGPDAAIVVTVGTDRTQ